MRSELNLKAVGFRSPDAFNAGAHDAINEILSRYSQSHSAEWNSFAAAWNGLAHRFRSTVDSHETWAELIASSSAPPPEERHRQERALFEFVVSSVSSVECFYYALYCIGAIILPTGFLMSKERDLKFRPKEVATLYGSQFASEPLSVHLLTFLANEDFKRLVELRNVLTHRGVMPRRHYLGGIKDRLSDIPLNPAALSPDWNYSFSLNPETTRVFLNLISAQLHQFMELAKEFIDRHLTSTAAAEQIKDSSTSACSELG